MDPGSPEYSKKRLAQIRANIEAVDMRQHQREMSDLIKKIHAEIELNKLANLDTTTRDLRLYGVVNGRWHELARTSHLPLKPKPQEDI